MKKKTIGTIKTICLEENDSIRTERKLQKRRKKGTHYQTVVQAKNVMSFQFKNTLSIYITTISITSGINQFNRC